MQQTAYDMRIIDWSSDVCSSDLHFHQRFDRPVGPVPDAQPCHALAIGFGILDADRLILLILVEHQRRTRPPGVADALAVEGQTTDFVALVVEEEHAAGVAAMVLIFLDRKSTRLNSSH